MDETFGTRVRTLREEAGLSLRKLAKLLGMSPAYLSKLERDLLPPPSGEYICSIADVLETNKDDLLAIAGKIAPDIIEKIIKKPQIARDLRNED